MLGSLGPTRGSPENTAAEAIMHAEHSVQADSFVNGECSAYFCRFPRFHSYEVTERTRPASPRTRVWKTSLATAFREVFRVCMHGGTATATAVFSSQVEATTLRRCSRSSFVVVRRRSADIPTVRRPRAVVVR